MEQYFVEIDDCQNNTQAIVRVTADNEEEAQIRALQALHINDNVFVVKAEDVVDRINEEPSLFVMDEDGEEIDVDEI